MIAGSTQRFEGRDPAAQFKELALPLLDDVYTLARYLLGSAADADDAVQECYLRAFRHFDTYHGPAIKPWLFAILRNVCNAEFARRSKGKLRNTEVDAETLEDTAPLWQEVRNTPETELLRQLDATTVRQLIAALPTQFREAIVLREINDLSYREIADVIGIPVGTVMSRLARARYMLRAAWNAKEGQPA
jgi:RNA polymerase sigma-70 factor, ECF subfamily